MIIQFLGESTIQAIFSLSKPILLRVESETSLKINALNTGPSP